MRAVMARWPFFALAVISCAASLMPLLLDLHYDGSGWRGASLWVSSVVAAPVWMTSELLMTLGDGRAYWSHDVLALTLPMFAALLLDWVREKRRSRTRQPKVAADSP